MEKLYILVYTSQDNTTTFKMSSIYLVIIVLVGHVFGFEDTAVCVFSSNKYVAFLKVAKVTVNTTSATARKLCALRQINIELNEYNNVVSYSSNNVIELSTIDRRSVLPGVEHTSHYVGYQTTTFHVIKHVFDAETLSWDDAFITNIIRNQSRDDSVQTLLTAGTMSNFNIGTMLIEEEIHPENASDYFDTDASTLLDTICGDAWNLDNGTYYLHLIDISHFASHDNTTLGVGYIFGSCMWARVDVTDVVKTIRTIAHETGHMLGSGHIMCDADNAGAVSIDQGIDVADYCDPLDLMGGGRETLPPFGGSTMYKLGFVPDERIHDFRQYETAQQQVLTLMNIAALEYGPTLPDYLSGYKQIVVLPRSSLKNLSTSADEHTVNSAGRYIISARAQQINVSSAGDETDIRTTLVSPAIDDLFSNSATEETVVQVHYLTNYYLQYSDQTLVKTLKNDDDPCFFDNVSGVKVCFEQVGFGVARLNISIQAQPTFCTGKTLGMPCSITPDISGVCNGTECVQYDKNPNFLIYCTSSTTDNEVPIKRCLVQCFVKTNPYGMQLSRNMDGIYLIFIPMNLRVTD